MDYPLLDVFWTMLWFFLWVIWLMLLVRIVVDIFRDDSLNGWAKAGWTIFVVILPFLGVFVYLIARGSEMGDRESAWLRQRETGHRHGGPSAGEPTGAVTGQAEQLARLAELKHQGDLTEEEYQRAKANVLAA